MSAQKYSPPVFVLKHIRIVWDDGLILFVVFVRRKSSKGTLMGIFPKEDNLS